MEYKEGNNWKCCFDPERGLYTAQIGYGVNCTLYEITPLSKKFMNQIKKNVRIPCFLVTAVFFASLGADTKVAKNI